MKINTNNIPAMISLLAKPQLPMRKITLEHIQDAIAHMEGLLKHILRKKDWHGIEITVSACGVSAFGHRCALYGKREVRLDLVPHVRLRRGSKAWFLIAIGRSRCADAKF